LYGTDQYDSVAEAQLAVEPVEPELISSHLFLVGRVIVQVGTYSGLAETSFLTVFKPTNVTSHNDLTNIQGGSSGEYYHLSSTQYTNVVISDGNQTSGDFLQWNGSSWISTSAVGTTGPTGPGGSAGSQGPTGPPGGGSSVSIDNTQVAFGSVSGLTSSQYFKFDSLNKNLIVGSNSTSTSINNILIGGCNNDSLKSCNQVILGGYKNLNLSSPSGVIIGSNDSLLSCGEYSSIISSCKSCFNPYTGGVVGFCFSSIIGGYNNQMISSAKFEFGNSIIGGCENKIDGGSSNLISSSEKSCIYGPSLRSSIIGSYNSQVVGGLNTVLIGVDGVSASSTTNLVYVGSLNIAKVTQDDTINNILVWDSSDYKVKWRDVTTISGGSGITGPQGVTGPAGPAGSGGGGSGTTGSQGPTGPSVGGFLYTRIADNTTPSSGEISFGFTDDNYFEIAVSKTTAKSENIDALLSTFTTPLKFMLQDAISGGFFLTYDVNVITSYSTYYDYDFGSQGSLSLPSVGTLLSLNFIQGVSQPGESSVVSLIDGATISTNASLGNVFTVTLGGNRTLANPTNPTNGKRVIWRFKQDGTGGRTITLGSNFRFGTDITSVVLSTAPNTTDYFGAIYNSLDSKWDVIAFIKGYS
jgi:hypothetical protein